MHPMGTDRLESRTLSLLQTASQTQPLFYEDQLLHCGQVSNDIGMYEDMVKSHFGL